MTAALSLRRLLVSVGLHEELLADGKRNRAFTKALRRRVVPGAHVVDVGAGTGVWAVTAARLGAARVVAIEQEPVLAPVIRALARENGVADRVEVITDRAERTTLPREFDLVVSETIGIKAFDEGIVPLLAVARDRFLKPGGAVIPETLSLVAAPVHGALPEPRGLLIATETWRGLCANLVAPAPTRLRLLAPSFVLESVDLRSARRRLRATELVARWEIPDGRALNAVALWSETQLAPGVRLSTRVGTSWPPVVLPVGPFRGRRGRLEIRLGRTGRVRTWRTTFVSGAGRETQDASPLLAYGALRARAR